MKLAPEITLDEYFAGADESRALFEVVREAMLSIAPATVRASKSQVAFRRRIAFAWTWWPAKYLDGEMPPLVLSIQLRRRDESPKWKQIVEPYPGRFQHHVEIFSADQVDDEVRAMLAEAWEAAA